MDYSQSADSRTLCLRYKFFLYHFFVICFLVNYLRLRCLVVITVQIFFVMSNYDSISSLQNIALTSGTDRGAAINVEPDNRFSRHTPADCSDRKNKLLPYHNVTNGRDKVMEGSAVVSKAQLPRKLFLAHRKLLTDIDRCHADLLACNSQSQFDF